MLTVQDVLNDPEACGPFEETWPKSCSCGQVITEEMWEGMHYLGIQKVPADYGIPDMELRNCSRCGSTMAVTVPHDFV